ncbi:MAG: diacylglycerol O-acyltransferase / wax synthase [Solirubrobacteraceae bacterium]|nr:diacylglycerol O-acyltransferase / wax synthase [Solirubrobacteraceae bacterium]
MAQQHLDRLSAIDAGFLAQEGPSTHMHIGGVVLLDGPPPLLEEFTHHVRSRLHLVPRYRQRVAKAPLETGLPLWIDDPTFNLGYHIRHTALPAPGDLPTLLTLAARVFSQRLDRSKPLWELYLVEGLDDGGFALISKTHHALVDGVSGADLATVLFDLSQEGTEVPPGEPWVPQRVPTRAELIARGVEGAARRVAGLAATAVNDAHPREVLARARELTAGVGEVARTALKAPPETPFNVKPGPFRRFSVIEVRLDRFKAIKDVLGGTVNDVVLTAVSGGLAHFLQQRGLRTEGMELRACVPVSVRTDATKASMGNEITIMMAPLPVGVADPVQRLARVREAMDGLKESKQALGAQAIAGMQDFAPPTVHAQASRLQFSSRMYNLLVTNVPGPQFPLFVLGRRMRCMFPIPFLAGDRALAIAIMSYDGGMNFGLLGDYDAMPDLDAFGEFVEASLAELLAAARDVSPPPGGNGGASSRGRTSRPRTSGPGSTRD